MAAVPNEGTLPAQRELAARRQWVTWNAELRDGKLTKVIKNPYTGRNGSSTDPKQWGTYAEACEAKKRHKHTGVGFVFSADDPYTGIDLDHCRDAETGELTAEAQRIVDSFASYAEVSPSGKGVHILIRAAMEGKGKHRGAYEAYSQGRYFTVTGTHLAGAAKTIEERQGELDGFLAAYLTPKPNAGKANTAPGGQRGPIGVDDTLLLMKARNAKDGREFTAMYDHGDLAGQPSESERDLKLCRKLAFWTGYDGSRMDRLFRLSACMRDKWDETHGEGAYGEMTIAEILRTPGESYSPSAARSERRQEDAPGDGEGEGEGAAQARDTQQAMLLRIAELATCFKTSGGSMYARAEVNGKHTVLHIAERGGGFRSWLVYKYSQATGRAPSPTALSQALEVVRARALMEAPTCEVWTRLAVHGERLYLDLGGESWECVEIDAHGWRIVNEPPVYFRRSQGMGVLPCPVRGGALDELRPFVNAGSDENWILMVGWLVSAMHPRGPYAHLGIHGTRGSAKSSTTRALRSVIDPATPKTRNVPKEDRDFAIAAQNTWVLALDNLSSMPLWFSDLLCRLSTGAGYATRTNYTDDAETIFDAKRPAVFNGIEELATRGDLLDRTIVVTLPPLQGMHRPESEIEAAFAAAHPRILGALLDVIVVALHNLDVTPMDGLTRMADIDRWVRAAEPALPWAAGRWEEVYKGNRDEAVDVALEASPVGQAVLSLMSARSHWIGSPSELHEVLSSLIGEKANAHGWPKNARALSGLLARIEPDLRARGITIESSRSKHGRTLEITKTLPDPSDGGVTQAVTQNAKGDANLPAVTQTLHVASPLFADAVSPEGRIGDAGDANEPSIYFSVVERGRERERGGRGIDVEEGVNVASPASPCPECGATRQYVFAGVTYCDHCQTVLSGEGA